MPDPKTFEKLRPCGNLEKFSTARHHLGFYNNVGSTAYYSHPISTIPLEHLVFHALHTVIQKHSILSAIPVDEDVPKTYFVRLPSIDLQTCVKFVERKTPAPADGAEDEELDAILEKEHNKNFKEDVGSKPYWRLIILYPNSSSATTQFSVSWVFHHALSDGTSGLLFHKDFLAALQTASPSTMNSGTVVESPKKELLPPLDDVHPLPLSISYLAKKQWQDWFPPKRPGIWTGGSMSASHITSHFKTVVLSSQSTKRLIQLSKENTTTITGTLQCLVAASVLYHLDANAWIHVDGAVSLRRFLQKGYKEKGIVVEDSIGAWVSQYDYNHRRRPLSPSTTASPQSVIDLFSWSEARNVKAAITKELSKNLKDSVVNLLRWIPNLPKWFQGMTNPPKARTDSFEFSNVGVFKAPKGGRDGEEVWKVGRCIFSQCGAVTGAAIGVSVVTGGDGCIVVGFSWLEGIVDNVFMAKVMSGLKEGVQGLTGWDETLV